MTYNFPYLKDSFFLKKFDKLKIKEQLVKIIVLTFDEKPIEEIQGKIISGNFSLDGSSGMRRTGNLTMVADEYENDLTDTKHLLSINKKVEVLIGFINTTDQYKNYPIIWFPQGTYVIISPNITHDVNGINISLTLHDKMALLNGECGGVLPASVIFNEVQDIDENGDIIITQPSIHQIIQQLVNHFGGQQLGKIIISDIDERIKKVMKWTGSTPLYFYQQPQSDGTIYNRFTTNQEQAKNKATDNNNIITFSYGEDVGYILTKFVYPGDLISNAGDTVVTILDQIKNVLGNYEYFYDVNGNFRFQEIKNYLNTSYSTTTLKNMDMNDYLADYSGGKSIYTFEDAEIIQSYSNTPQYQQIKNDFVVWGKRQSIDGNEIPIRYHLAIDKKPKTGNKYKVFFFLDPDDHITKAKRPFEFNSRSQFPIKGEVEQYYLINPDTESEEDQNDKGKIYKWSPEAKDYIETAYTIETITATDFRTELYMAGVASQPFGLDSNYYFTELKNEWPKLYDMRKQNFFEEVQNQPSDIDFFLDFIDTPTALAEFSIENIGRRTHAYVDESINCIFQPDNPDIVIIEASSEDAADLRAECEKRKQQYCQVNSQIYSMLMNGGVLRSAYEQIRKELYQYTNYNQQISLTTIPIYYLEPNTRITVRDTQSGIFGDYIIKSISLPLDINSTMSLSCTRALERI